MKKNFLKAFFLTMIALCSSIVSANNNQENNSKIYFEQCNAIFPESASDFKEMIKRNYDNGKYSLLYCKFAKEGLNIENWIKERYNEKATIKDVDLILARAQHSFTWKYIIKLELSDD